MGFLELKVVEGWKEDKYIFMDDLSNTYIIDNDYGYKHSTLEPYLHKKLLVFETRGSSNNHGSTSIHGTVMATIDGMTILDWINWIPNMGIEIIFYDIDTSDFLDMVKSQYSIDVNKTEVTMTNLKRVMVKSESSRKTMEEKKWLLGMLSTLQFIHNKYGRKIK